MSRYYEALVTAIIAAAAACGGRHSPADRAEPEQAMLRKLDPYLQCHLDHSQVVFRTEDLYRLDFADAPPGPASTIVLLPTPDPASCIAAIAAAKAVQPAVPALEAAGAAYATELARVHRLTTAYDRAKATEMHAELLSAFDAFDRAEAALFDQVYASNRTMHLAQLAQREDKEEEVALLMERAQLAAEDVARFAAVPWTQLDQLDADALAASVAGLERAVSALDDYEREGPERVATLERFFWIRDHARALVVAARQLGRRAREHLAFNDAERLMIREGNEKTVIGTPAALAYAYNRVAESR